VLVTEMRDRMLRARSLMLGMALVFLGCASASDGEVRGPVVASLTSVRAPQAPAVEKSASAIQTASASQKTSAVPISPAAADDEAEADLVESGVMSEPQRAIMQGVGRCLERALRKEPGPGGSLALGVTVDGEGTVTDVELGPGYPASAKPCVEARVKSVRFAREPNGGIRHYRYPINEQPSDDEVDGE
jgi:hypothetical protein